MDSEATTPWWGLLGVGTMLAGVGVLAFDIPALNTTWFLFGWVGYLLLLDALICVAQGHSFLVGRRRELGAMLWWSVPYWCIFEAYNLVLENWSYVFLPHGEVAQALFAFIAFATVLPACFFHAELLKALGTFEHTRWRPLPVSPRVEAGVLVFGIAAVVLPLLWPIQWFWLVWAVTLGVPEVINRRLGLPSLLADLEQGDPRRFLRLLAGGLLAGFVWESLNFFARAKWVYTVPFFEESKLFEMPLLGFLGFPALSVEAFSGYVLLCHVARAGRHWEWADVDQPQRLASRHRTATFLLIVGYSALTNVLTLDPAVVARRPLLQELRGLTPADVITLEDAGIPTPEWLCRQVESGQAPSLASGRLPTAYEHANLALHKGMGTDAAAALLDLGIRTPADLAGLDAGTLSQRLQAAGFTVRASIVGVWIRAAHPEGGRRR